MRREPDTLFTNTLFGIPMLQLWTDLRLWEWVLSNHPVRTVIELGTGNGAFSIYLALQCHMRGLCFVTLDRNPCGNLARAPLSIRQIVGDMWSSEVQAELRAHLAERPCLLFCDGGNKPREFQTFTPWLTPGDIVAVHDAGTEFNHDNDAKPVAHMVEALLPASLYQFPDSFTLFYRRR